ncbi:hypothetical protein [Motilimonas pumila]|uniref:Uncharacterized protein n=1 Tax=Motilimonas pumila TaxID=2303987 RepID=A0A418Y9G2_9GAMM|nr:hypothetical protein [Motilimonas pumila]RJG37350.1 hypothetical protein D1Z90_19840 [Motilimonas pumila]
MAMIYLSERKGGGSPVYCTYHKHNHLVFDSFEGSSKFEIVNAVDEVSPTSLMQEQHILKLMDELKALMALDIASSHQGLRNHLKEVLVLCKFCIWNPGKYILHITPFGFAASAYPEQLAPNMRYSLLDESG